MKKKIFKIMFCLVIWIMVFSPVWSKTIGVFYDKKIDQHEFAANEVKMAFVLKGFNIELFDIKYLTQEYSNQKVVIALQTDSITLSIFIKEGGKTFGELSEQAFAIRTNLLTKNSYWVFGGDINGAMYGGLQLAENINLFDDKNTFDEVQFPDILNRGIKFNIPFDRRSPTYYSSGFSENDFRGTSTKMAIEHVWNLSFWSSIFDELSRHRYNALSLWSLHPFTSMVKLVNYPDVAIEDIEGFDGFFKTMSIDEKIEFWKDVMVLAKNRGIDIYLYNWNIYTYGATGKYGIENNANNQSTISYMRRCITSLFETYPDLKGFGVTAGENMGAIGNEEAAKWTWETYGKGVWDFAKSNPDREIVFIHRYHDAGGAEIAHHFKPLLEMPNVEFDFSFKYAVAHIYSSTTPDWIRTRNGDVPAQLIDLDLKTWLELRNDSFYYLHWGDPSFVKEYLAVFPEKEKIVKGFFMGSDGYTPTYTFTSIAPWSKGKLEIQRTWYTWMLWGRIAYNPNLNDTFFQKAIQFRYPENELNTLFTAWKMASKGIPLFTEVIQGTLISDFKWYPEACMSRPNGFVTIEQMEETVPTPGSNFCSIAETAAGNCGVKKPTYLIADEIEKNALIALKEISSQQLDLTTELGTNIGNIKAMAYLSLYYAEKLRGATFHLAEQKEKAMHSMGEAFLNWSKYSKLMSEMYHGQNLQRSRPIHDWQMLDEEALAEFVKLGGDPNTLTDVKKN